jgi:hypothetical protein
MGWSLRLTQISRLAMTNRWNQRNPSNPWFEDYGVILKVPYMAKSKQAECSLASAHFYIGIADLLLC